MTRAVAAGLVLLGLLSLVDAAGLFLTDGETPPLAVALRLLSAATAVPAFTAGGVPAPAQAIAAAGIVLTLLGCGLVLPALRRRTGVST